jgi:hypothetical protein
VCLWVADGSDGTAYGLSASDEFVIALTDS